MIARALLDAIWPPRHRWICTECKQTWDRRFEGFFEPGHEWGTSKSPLHFRAIQLSASDGPRTASRQCGPIKYEGKRAW